MIDIINQKTLIIAKILHLNRDSKKQYNFKIIIYTVATTKRVGYSIGHSLNQSTKVIETYRYCLRTNKQWMWWYIGVDRARPWESAAGAAFPSDVADALAIELECG